MTARLIIKNNPTSTPTLKGDREYNPDVMTTFNYHFGAGVWFWVDDLQGRGRDVKVSTIEYRDRLEVRYDGMTLAYVTDQYVQVWLEDQDGIITRATRMAANKVMKVAKLDLRVRLMTVNGVTGQYWVDGSGRVVKYHKEGVRFDRPSETPLTD